MIKRAIKIELHRGRLFDESAEPDENPSYPLMVFFTGKATPMNFAAHLQLRGLWLCVALAVAIVQPVSGADDLEVKFRAAKGRIVTELRSPKPEVREKALATLRDFPVPQAIDTLLQQGELTKYPDVARGSFDILLSFANSLDVCKHLQSDLLQELAANKVGTAGKVRLLVLLSSTEPQVQTLLPKVFEQAGQSPGGLLLVATTIDEYAAAATPENKRALVQALCKLNDKQAVSKLVDFLTTAEGETRADIERRMLQLSGLKPADRTDWPTWWREKEADFEFPTGPTREIEVVANPGSASYYGLPVYGSKLVFIADYSGSMQGAQMDAAKRELLGTIAQLPDGVRFNIIAFNSQVFPWKRELQPVSPESRKEAMAFVGSGQAAAMTNSYDALSAGLLQDCDAIYFLTDGAPTVGKLTKPFDIISSITRTNRVRRATINCIGIGVGGAGGTFDTFLNELSTKNFGAYRKIN
jgi:hypothetical protein